MLLSLLLTPLVLIPLLVSRPLLYTKNDVQIDTVEIITKRSLSIIEEAGEIGAVISYVSCEMADESMSAAAALGIEGVKIQKCIAPPGMASSLSTSSPVVAQSTPAPVVISQPAVMSSTPIAPISQPLPIAASVPAPVSAPEQVPIPVTQPLIVTPRPPTSPSPPPPAPLDVDTPLAVAIPLPIEVPVIVATPVNTLLGPIPTTASKFKMAEELNACISSDKDVCYQQALALESHNVARRAHHVPDLVWNNDLAAAAKRWSTHCIWQHSGGALFPPSYTYGECLYASSDSAASTAKAIEAYTNEEIHYGYDNPGFSEATGHFTQVVWKSTTEVGCAIVDCQLSDFAAYTNASSYQTCIYYSSGNYNDQFQKNVLRP